MNSKALSNQITDPEKIVSVTGVSREEAETVISIEPTLATAEIYTNDNVMINRMRGLFKRQPEHFKCYVNSFDTEGNPACYVFTCPKKCVMPRAPMGTKVMTEEQKAAAAERMRQIVERQREQRKQRKIAK